MLTAGNNCDTDEFTDTHKFYTGTIVSLYVKPKTEFSRANVYGLIGLAYWEVQVPSVPNDVDWGIIGYLGRI